MSTISLFKSIAKKGDVYTGKNSMKNFCGSLREHAVKTVNFKKKKNEVINKGAAGTI